MVPFLQLAFICPAVTQEGICILRDKNAHGSATKPIRLQILIPVFSPIVHWKFCHTVLLKEEEFRFASQRRALISCKLMGDTVHMQAHVPWISTQEVIWGTTADYATGKDVTLCALSHGFFENCENFAPAQPLMDDYVEVKRLKGLFQQIWMRKEGVSTLDTEYLFSKSVGAKCLTSIVTYTVYDDANPSGVTGYSVEIQLILTERRRRGTERL